VDCAYAADGQMRRFWFRPRGAEAIRPNRQQYGHLMFGIKRRPVSFAPVVLHY